MADEKKCTWCKAAVVLLVIDTLLLACVCLKLCGKPGQSGFCFLPKKEKVMCPYVNNSMQGSGSAMESMPQDSGQ